MKSFVVASIFLFIALVLAILFFITAKSLSYYHDNIGSNGTSNVFKSDENTISVFGFKNWYERLSAKPEHKFEPIVNILSLHFELDNSEIEIKRKFYKLEIDQRDTYSLFCVRHTIGESGVKYFYASTKDELSVIVDSEDTSKVHYLIDTLRRYNLKVQVDETWL